MLLWVFRRYFLLVFIIGQCCVEHTSAIWPSVSNAKVQLLGLFPDPENTTTPDTFSVHPRAMFKAAIILSQRFGMTIGGELLGWQVAQTGGNVVNALKSTCQLISNPGIIGIVGPAYSRESNDVAALAERIGIPIISYAATDPALSDRNLFPTFYRTVCPDDTAAIAIGKLFRQYNWTSSIIIYQNDAFGINGAKFISQAFNEIEVAVRKTVIFDIITKKIRGDLKSLLTSSSTRVVVVWVDPVYTPFVIKIALENDVLGPQFTWILSSSIPLTSFNQTLVPKLVGMFTVEPVVASVVDAPYNNTLLAAAYGVWAQYEPETFPGPSKVNSYALFAFDATWSLILSLQEMCSTATDLSSPCIALNNASYCFDRRYLHSRALLDTLNNITFLGVSGPVQFSAEVSDRINGTYYYAQNAQRSANGVNFTPVLKYSTAEGWRIYGDVTVIVWPGNSLKPPTDRPVLEGVTLRIAVIQAIPFTMLTYVTNEFGQNTTKFIGYIPDLIDLLQYNMKFNPDVILAPSNKTYNQIIQDLANGVYDVIMGDVTITATRRKLVSFSNSIFDNSLRIIMRKSRDESVDLLSYLKTFSTGLWLMLLATGIVAAGLMCILERQENEALQNRSMMSLMTMGMWYSLGVIVGYGVDFHVRTAAGRVLTVGLYIISLVFVATYTANLASYLTLTKTKNIISGIEDVKSGKIPFNRIGVRLGTSIEGFYLREISNGVKNYYPLSSRPQQYQSLLDGLIDVSFMDIGVAEYATNNIYCNLTLIGGDFDKSAFGIVIPKDWIYAQDLDVNILALRETGRLDTLRIKWFQAKTCQGDYNGPTAMGIESLGGLFLLFGVISILSMLLFLWKNRYIINKFISNLFRQRPTSIPRSTTIVQNSIKIPNDPPAS